MYVYIWMYRVSACEGVCVCVFNNTMYTSKTIIIKYNHNLIKILPYRNIDVNVYMYIEYIV